MPKLHKLIYAQQDMLIAIIGALINLVFYKSYEKLLLEKRSSKSFKTNH